MKVVNWHLHKSLLLWNDFFLWFLLIFASYILELCLVHISLTIVLHGWRCLIGYSPWGHEESDTTERLHFHFSLSCIREGHGNPLQYSCLENPRDGRAWWAAIYGVAQSRTWLMRLSSSSSLMNQPLYHCILCHFKFEHALGVGDGQGSLACWSPWGHKESEMTELNWTDPLPKRCL